MNEQTPDTAVEQPAKVEPQTVDPKPAKPTKPAKAHAPKAKAKPAKKATKPAVNAKAKAKKAKTPKQAKVATKAKVALKAKPAKVVKAGKFPRHAKNPFREGSAYGQIFDGFVRKDNGLRRDELLQLAMDATGKDVKHAAYDLAVIRSAKESNKGPRHPSCREGFWVKREGDCLTLMVD